MQKSFTKVIAQVNQMSHHSGNRVTVDGDAKIPCGETVVSTGKLWIRTCGYLRSRS